MTRIEDRLKEQGYVLIDETAPFRIYERNKERLVFHYPSDKVWGKFDLENPLNNAKGLKKEKVYK